MRVLDALRDALGIGHEGAVQYRCRTCDREFAYAATIDEPDCPYCDATDVRELSG